MRKSILVVKDEKGVSIQPKEGFITDTAVLPVRDSKELVVGIFSLLGIGDDYIVVLRKRRKE